MLEDRAISSAKLLRLKIYHNCLSATIFSLGREKLQAENSLELKDNTNNGVRRQEMWLNKKRLV